MARKVVIVPNATWSYPQFRIPTYVITVPKRHRQTDGRHAISKPCCAL